MKNKNSHLQWSIIIALSTLGLLHGTLSLFGLVQGWEYAIWIFFGLVSIAVLIKKVMYKLLVHGLLIGLGITLLTGLPQSLFLDMYLEANPDYQDLLDPDRNYSLFILTFIPVFGSIYGLLIGLLGWGMNGLLRKLQGTRRND